MFARLRNSRFLRDAAVLQVASGFTSIGNLVSTIALAFLLGSHQQGAYYTAMSLYAIFYLLTSVGLSTVTVSNVARAISAGDRDGVVAWLGFLTKAGAILGVLLFVLALLFMNPVGDYFYDDQRVADWAIWLCLLPPIELPRVVCAAGFQGARRMVDLAQLENCLEIGRVFFVISGIVIMGKAEGAVWGTLLAGALGSLMGVISYRRVRRELLADEKAKAVLPSFRELLGGMGVISMQRGLPLGIQVGFMRNLDALLLETAPMLIIAAVGGPSSVAYFRNAQRFLRVPLNFLQGISRTAMPAMSGLSQLKDPAQFKRLFYRATFGGGLFVGLGLLATAALIPWATDFFLPDDYSASVTLYALILLPGFVITGFSGAIESFYIASHRVKAALKIGFIFGPPLVLLMLGLGQWLGPDGVVIACSLTLSIGFVHHLYIWRCFRSATPILPAPTLSGDPS